MSTQHNEITAVKPTTSTVTTLVWESETATTGTVKVTRTTLQYQSIKRGGGTGIVGWLIRLTTKI